MKQSLLILIGIAVVVLGVILDMFIVFRVIPQQKIKQNATTSTSSSLPITGTPVIKTTLPGTSPENLPAATTTTVPRQTTPIIHLIDGEKELLWGAYVGDNPSALSDFEKLVGKQVHYYADFEGWNDSFPLHLSSVVGKEGKTLIIFWEPQFGYDSIIDNSKDDYIKQFAADAKSYGYPIILVPFPEMNLNEEAWGYGQNNNTALKFKIAWTHIHTLFAGAKNVKFGIAFNSESIPDVAGNKFSDYYPGKLNVDYVGADGFNFGDPQLSFAQIFDASMSELSKYNKPIIIFSMASIAGPGKAEWIKQGLGEKVKSYKNVVGWVWFNQGGNPDWLVNSDPESLKAFKEVIP